MAISVGDVAPDFELTDQNGETVRLSDFRGDKNVLLVFYPMAFTGICTDEMCSLRDDNEDFSSDDVAMFSISCDSVPTLKKFAETEGITHRLLSDWWPHGKAATDYGVFLEDKGFATRGSFVIDKEGIVRWSVINGPGDARSNDDYRAALAELS